MASRSKQTEIHPPPKLQGEVAIGGIAVETEFVHCYKYSVVDLQIIMCIRMHVTLVYPIYPPLFAFEPETVSKWAVCWPYWYERGGGSEHCFVYFGKPFMNMRVRDKTSSSSTGIGGNPLASAESENSAPAVNECSQSPVYLQWTWTIEGLPWWVIGRLF